MSSPYPFFFCLNRVPQNRQGVGGKGDSSDESSPLKSLPQQAVTYSSFLGFSETGSYHIAEAALKARHPASAFLVPQNSVDKSTCVSRRIWVGILSTLHTGMAVCAIACIKTQTPRASLA